MVCFPARCGVARRHTARGLSPAEHPESSIQSEAVVITHFTRHIYTIRLSSEANHPAPSFPPHLWPHVAGCGSGGMFNWLSAAHCLLIFTPEKGSEHCLEYKRGRVGHSRDLIGVQLTTFSDPSQGKYSICIHTNIFRSRESVRRSLERIVTSGDAGDASVRMVVWLSWKTALVNGNPPSRATPAPGVGGWRRLYSYVYVYS